MSHRELFPGMPLKRPFSRILKRPFSRILALEIFPCCRISWVRMKFRIFSGSLLHSAYPGKAPEENSESLENGLSEKTPFPKDPFSEPDLKILYIYGEITFTFGKIRFTLGGFRRS